MAVYPPTLFISDHFKANLQFRVHQKIGGRPLNEKSLVIKETRLMYQDLKMGLPPHLVVTNIFKQTIACRSPRIITSFTRYFFLVIERGH